MFIAVTELLLKERWTDNILLSLLTFSYYLLTWCIALIVMKCYQNCTCLHEIKNTKCLCLLFQTLSEAYTIGTLGECLYTV